MNNAISNFYKTDNNLKNELKVLDGTVDFQGETEFISKTGIKKDLQKDAIEIVVELVKSGKMNAWDIDIVDLYDKYMDYIKKMKQENLPAIGKAILFASILLRIKSDILQGITVDDFNENPEDLFDDDYEGDWEQGAIPTNNIISFDEALQRRTSVRLNRKRTVTLKDLIRHIQYYQDLEEKYAIKNALDKKARKVRNYSKLNVHDIKELAHDEFVEQVVEKMRQNLIQIFKKEDKIELRELCLLGFDRSSAFIALLVLVRDGMIDLDQEEFYGKLYAIPAKAE